MRGGCVLSRDARLVQTALERIQLMHDGVEFVLGELATNTHQNLLVITQRMLVAAAGVVLGEALATARFPRAEFLLIRRSAARHRTIERHMLIIYSSIFGAGEGVSATTHGPRTLNVSVFIPTCSWHVALRATRRLEVFVRTIECGCCARHIIIH